MTTRSFAEPALDLFSHLANLPESFAPNWSVAAQLYWRFYRWGEHTIMRTPRGLHVVGAGLPGPDGDAWHPIRTAATVLRASEIAPLVMASGTVYRWNVSDRLERLLDYPRGAAANDLPGGGFLISELDGRDAVDLSAVDADGQLRWRRPQLDANYVSNDYVVAWTAGLDAIVRIDPATGATSWSWTPPTTELVFAIGEVDGRLWFGWRPWSGPCQIVALDLVTGAAVAEVACAGIDLPRLESDGIAAACVGSNYVRLDLRNGGVEIERRTWPASTLAHGSHLRTTDDRVIFRDRKGGIWQLRNDGGHPEPIWQSPEPLVTLATAHRGLLVLDINGLLTRLD